MPNEIPTLVGKRGGQGILPPTAPADIEQRRHPLNTRDPAAGIPRSALIPPFWQIRPPGGTDLAGAVRGQVPAGIGSQLLLTPNPRFTIINGYGGVLAGLSLTVLLPLATLDITGTILANGAPVQGWDSFRPQNVGANAIILELSGPLQLPSGTELQFLWTNNAVSGPWDVQVNMTGWMWPQVLEMSTFGYLY